ncbi:hypothetical protein [Streptomyces antibioticus]|uniref:hypothetical protein n=1 Tax=Streptomyces antibioticus TaxID=1890 RepID=UPI0033B616F9
MASPGRAAPGGVPADRSAELRAELAQPLALLEQAEADAQSVRERAGTAAAARLQEAEILAEELVAEAREEAPRARESAAERSLRAAEAEATDLLADAEREAAAVHDRAGGRMPALTERALALVREDITAEPKPDITAQPKPPPSPEAGS